eukprot:UN31011
MGRLKDLLQKEFKQTNIVDPANCQSVEIEFRRKKEIKVVGKLADGKPVEGHKISGLIVKKDFHHQLLTPDDLSLFTPLATTEIDQELLIPFDKPLSALTDFLSSVFELDISEETNEVKVYDIVNLRVKKHQIIMKWSSCPVNDLVADSIVGLIMTLQTDVTGAVATILSEVSNASKDETDWFDFFFVNILVNNYGMILKPIRTLFESKMRKHPSK